MMIVIDFFLTINNFEPFDTKSPYMDISTEHPLPRVLSELGEDPT